MTPWEEHLQSKEHDAMSDAEDAFFEENRVEISCGTALLFLFFVMPRMLFWAAVIGLVAFAVMRRMPFLLPHLRRFWRTWLLPLAKIDDWIMLQWRSFKVAFGKKRKEWANDWVHLREWLRLAFKRNKDERIVAAMAQQHGALAGRLLSPVSVLGYAPALIAFCVGVFVSGMFQEWRIGRVKHDLRETRQERNEAVINAQGWSKYAHQRDADYATLKAQRAGELRQAASEQLKTAELLEEAERRRQALARNVRRRNDEAAKAAAGGPPPDWERGVLDIAGPSAERPPVGSVAPTETSGDPPG